MSAIEAIALTKTYGSHRGIDTLNLSVEPASLFGLLGPNGAGKTTLIRVLMGLLRPSAGQARILGKDCWHDGADVRAEVGFLPGDIRLPRWLNCKRALKLFGRARRQDIYRRGLDLAERFQLPLDVPVRAMSRGTRQKLGIVLAMAHDPRVLILDEPASGLYPLMQHELHTLLREFVTDGHTVFFSSHTLSEVDELCDHVAIIRQSRLVACEPLENLRRQAGHQVTIRWANEEARPASAPAALRVDERTGGVWNGVWSGPVDELVSWLHEHQVADLAIARPDLDTLFRGFYMEAEAP